jgi:flagellin-like protein
MLLLSNFRFEMFRTNDEVVEIYRLRTPPMFLLTCETATGRRCITNMKYLLGVVAPRQRQHRPAIRPRVRLAALALHPSLPGQPGSEARVLAQTPGLAPPSVDNKQRTPPGCTKATMKLESIKSFVMDRRAVSPVLGVALLIAITVILAGVIGFVVLGVGSGNTDGPSASLVADDLDTIVHKGGDELDTADVTVMVNGASSAYTVTGGDAILNSGEEITITTSPAAGDSIRVVWNDPNSDREVLLAEFTAE